MALRKRIAATVANAKTGGRDDWQTPETVLDRVRQIGPIGLDPCGARENPCKARINWWAPMNDAFKAAEWSAVLADDELAFANPPYSRMTSTKAEPGWANFIAYQGTEAGAEVVSLVAARPGSRWFDYLVWQTASAVCFWRGRLTFVGAPFSALFPSAVVYHGPRPWVFEAAFHSAGAIVRLKGSR